MNDWNLRQEYAVTIRTGTSGTPDCGQFPGLSSRTPSSPGVVQTQDRGGSSFALAGLAPAVGPGVGPAVWPAAVRASCSVEKSPSETFAVMRSPPFTPRLSSLST